MDTDVTEFAWIDPEELHLVGEPATKVGPLLAKSKAPSPTKGKSKMSKKAKRKALTSVAKQGTITPESADAAVRTALGRMAKEAARADKDGDGWRARSLRQEIATLKMSLSVRSQSSASRYGNFVHPLPISNRRALPDDPQVGGI